MNTSKIIRGIVNSRGYTTTSAITQWDYGYVFVPEFEDMPSTYRLDFSNDEHHGTALPVYCGSEGGEVPEELIDTGKDIWVWFFYIGDGFGKSEYKWRIPNKCKPKTEQDEPTPSQQSSIDQLIIRSNEAVETAEQSASDASTSAQNASADAERAEEARTDAQNYATQAEQSATDAHESASQASASASASAQSAQSASQSAQTASEKADAITGLTAQAQTLPEGSSATASYDAQTGVLNLGIPKGKDGTNGIDGDDGYSPTANVSKSGNTATISITDKNGTTSAQIEDGEKGTDGVSPTVSVSSITGGHEVSITDAQGTQTFDVMDGTDASATDVQINGTSIVSDGVANVPIASADSLGLVRIETPYGLSIINNGAVAVGRASQALVKAGSNYYKSIVPYNQHESTFYGLAKIAGHDEMNSTLPVGTYTEEAKIAIQKMLGIYEPPYELLNDFTLEEESGFDLTADMNGTPYDLRNVFIYVFYPSNLTAVTTGYGRYRCYDSNGKGTNAETGRYSTNTAGYKYITVERKANLAFSNFTNKVATGDSTAWRINRLTTTASTGVAFDLGSITRITCIDNEPAGTQIKIYGQRAY